MNKYAKRFVKKIFFLTLIFFFSGNYLMGQTYKISPEHPDQHKDVKVGKLLNKKLRQLGLTQTSTRPNLLFITATRPTARFIPVDSNPIMAEIRKTNPDTVIFICIANARNTLTHVSYKLENKNIKGIKAKIMWIPFYRQKFYNKKRRKITDNKAMGLIGRPLAGAGIIRPTKKPIRKKKRPVAKKRRPAPKPAPAKPTTPKLILKKDITAIPDDKGYINFPYAKFAHPDATIWFDFPGRGWNLVPSKTPIENALLQNRIKESAFFSSFYIHSWAAHAKRTMEARQELVYSSGILKPLAHYQPFLDFYDKQQKKINKEAYPGGEHKYFDDIRREAIEGMAYRYKIHFQIKPEYFVSFVNDFIQFFYNDPILKKYVSAFKFTQKFRPGSNYYHIDTQIPPDISVPIVVVYPALLPGTKTEKNNILQQIIKTIINRYHQHLDIIHLPIMPRFNRHIKGFIYLAGGDGDDKKILYRNIITSAPEKKAELKAIKNKTYTDDFAYFKGYEYDKKH